MAQRCAQFKHVIQGKAGTAESSAVYCRVCYHLAECRTLRLLSTGVVYIRLWERGYQMLCLCSCSSWGWACQGPKHVEDSSVTYMLLLNCALKLVEEINLETSLPRTVTEHLQLYKGVAKVRTLHANSHCSAWCMRMSCTYMRKGRFQFVRMTCYEESILLVWYTVWIGK